MTQEWYRTDAGIVQNRCQDSAEQRKDGAEQRKGSAEQRKDGAGTDAKIVLDSAKMVLDRHGSIVTPCVGSDAGQLTVDTVEEGSGGHTLLAGWLQFLY